MSNTKRAGVLEVLRELNWWDMIFALSGGGTSVAIADEYQAKSRELEREIRALEGELARRRGTPGLGPYVRNGPRRGGKVTWAKKPGPTHAAPRKAKAGLGGE